MNQSSRFSHFDAASPQQGQPAVDDDFIDLGRLLHAVLRYKWGILGLAFAVALFTGLWVYTLQPVYRASASIVLEFDNNIVPSVEQQYNYGYRNYDYYETQFEILKSRALAERVVRRLQLQKHPLFLPQEKTEDEGGFRFRLDALLPAGKQEPPKQLTPEEEEEQRIQAVTSAVAGGLSVQPLEYSYLAYLNYEFTDPVLAAEIVNALAEEFIKSDLEVRLAGTLQATDWLDSRMADLRANLEASEQALQAFREREGLVEVQGVTNLGANELQILAQRLDDARRARIEAQNIKEEVRRLGGAASTDELMTLPAVLEHELIRDLKRAQSLAERKVAELAKRYGPKHPVMIAARSDLEAANADLAREVRKVVSGIEREYEVALRNEQELQATFDESKSDIQNFNRVEFRLRELEREVETNRELYDVFFDRLKTVSETGGFEKPHARIVDRARVPSHPIKPNKRMAITLAFVLGAMLGCGAAILLDMLDNTVKGPDDVQDKLGVPLLGSLPKQKADKQGDFEQAWQAPQSLYAEAVRTLRTSLLLSSPDRPVQVIVVTSTVPGEGKSTTVLNLASALGQMENVLVIGADLRRPSLAPRCGLAPNHRGLSHFVADNHALEDCMEKVDALGVHVMPAGLIPPNPLELISSRRFSDALGLLRQRFDRIVIDSAPVQAVSDALVLASYADSVVYIVKAGDTPATAAHRGIAAVMANNEPLTGVVLNQLEVKKAGRYAGGGYYNYSDYGSAT